MKKVFKYVLKHIPLQAIKMPAGSFILTAGMQQGKVCLWAEVQPGNPDEPFYYAIVLTGGDLPLNGLHVGTVFDDSEVWHIYQLTVQP